MQFYEWFWMPLYPGKGGGGGRLTSGIIKQIFSKQADKRNLFRYNT